MVELGVEESKGRQADVSPSNRPAKFTGSGTSPGHSSLVILTFTIRHQRLILLLYFEA